MDCNLLKERDIVIDIKDCLDTGKEIACSENTDNRDGHAVSIRVCDFPMSATESVKCGNSAIIKSVEVSTPHSCKTGKKDKSKTTSGKRSWKPPRPPRGFSLDAADQKLIKEITELAMIKRARIERMKALKKMKAAKASSTPASSSGNMISLLFTLLFCAVIIFQGCHSSGMFTMNNSEMGRFGPTEISTSTAPPTGPGSPLAGFSSPSLLESTSNSDGKYRENNAIS